jgi:methylmalonyl-CoA/ethylmalonyl-CoA epimerase
MKAKAIDHICIAVRDLQRARRQYEDVLGLTPDGTYEAPSESIRVVRYYLGDVALELMEPMNDTCEVARFLERRGEGVFLISYRVDDVEAGLEELAAKGLPLIDRKPRRLMGNRYAFILPPKMLGGVLTEILDGTFDRSYDNPTTD